MKLLWSRSLKMVKRFIMSYSNLIDQQDTLLRILQKLVILWQNCTKNFQCWLGDTVELLCLKIELTFCSQ